MQDTELYRHVLGLEAPWRVESVQLDIRSEQLDIWAVHGEGMRWPCPECGAMRPVYNHAPGRVLRHLDTSQLKTFLHARIFRLECPTHELKQAKVSWAEERARFTALFERLAIMVLRERTLRALERSCGSAGTKPGTS